MVLHHEFLLLHYIDALGYLLAACPLLLLGELPAWSALDHRAVVLPIDDLTSELASITKLYVILQLGLC